MTPFRLVLALACATALVRPLAAQTQTNSYPVDPFERPYNGATRADVPREVTLVQPGMRVQIQMPTLPGYRRNGTLRSVSGNSVTVQTSDGQMLTVPTSDLDGISVSLGRSAREGVVRGLLIGGAAGLLIGPLAGNDGGDEPSRSITSIARPENVAIGAAVGALVGSVWRHEVWRRAARATPDELSHAVRELTPVAPAGGMAVAPFAGAPLDPASGTVAAGLSIRF
ncbi:MAG TPA: hypothetical protein VF705_08065 [Longimicrobium sp.]|jgi:hypothetical protein